jgi:hypothetical protein
MRAARDDDALERDRLDPPIERIAAESHFLDDARERMRAAAASQITDRRNRVAGGWVEH